MGEELSAEILKKISDARAKRSLPKTLLIECLCVEKRMDWALQIASLFFCQTQSACGFCSGCAAVKAGFEPDVLVLDQGESMIKLAEAKKVSEHLDSLPASKDNARIVVIHNLDQLSHAAANSLLKVFEEPPEFAMIIATTGKKSRIPQTLLSRCMKLKIRSNLPELALELTADESDFFSQMFQDGDRQKIPPTLEVFLKEKGYDIAVLIRKIELSLNLFYRDQIEQNSGYLMSKMARRQIMQNAKKTVFRDKTKLNAQLFLEELCLSC